jgi:DNA-binding LacI/PurR family transcriptional regulator
VQPIEEIGKNVIEQLIKMLQGNDVRKFDREIVLNTKLIERESSGVLVSKYSTI